MKNTSYTVSPMTPTLASLLSLIDYVAIINLVDIFHGVGKLLHYVA